MSTTYFYSVTDPPRMIGSESDAVFIWSMPSNHALHIAREFAEDTAVIDSGGHTYTGDAFWTLAGQWDWVRGKVT